MGGRILRSSGNRRAEGVALVVLVLLPWLFYWRLLTPDAADRGSFPPGDFAVQFYAFARYQAQRLTSGEVPLWCNGAYSGFPFLADIQAAAFYPLRLLAIALGSLWGFPFLVLELEAAFHFSLAAAFTYLFARRVFGHSGPAFLTALVFTFSGYLTGYPSQQLAILESGVWLPLALLFADKAVSERRFLNCWTLLLAVSLALSALAGHPQTVMYVFYTVAVYSIWRRPRWSSLGVLAVAMPLAAGLAAAQLLPAAEYFGLSSRASTSYDAVSGGFPVQDVVQILLPGSVSGYSPLYVGILPLLLIGAALVLRPERGVRFWLLVALVALLVSFGNQAFLHSLFYLFAPGWSLFRSQERLAFIFAFSLSLLAGYGAAALLSGQVLRQRMAEFVRACGLLWSLPGSAVVIFFLGLLNDGWSPGSSFYWLLGSAVFAAMVWFLAWALLRWWVQSSPKPTAFVALAGALIVFDLFTVGWRHNFSSMLPEEHEAMPAAVDAILADAGPEPFRVFNEWRLAGNYGVQFGLDAIWGASPLRLRRYQELVQALPVERLWQLLNVRYVVTWARELPVASEVIHREAAAQDETTYVHRLTQPGPRAWLVHRIEQVDPQEALQRLQAPDFDPRRTALVERELPCPLSTSEGNESVRILAREPESITLEVQAAGDALLILSEVFYPGWHATVDGAEAPVLLADYTLRAVPVPAGSHIVKLHYRPWTWMAGLGVSLASVVVLAAGLILLRGETALG